MPTEIELKVNGKRFTVREGTTVAAALAMAGVGVTRKSVTGMPRGPLCGMGVCFECRVTSDGRPHGLACQVACRPGMEVTTDVD